MKINEKINFTISERGYTTTTESRHRKVIIYNTDNKQLTFKELFNYLKSLSTKKVFDKKWDSPRLYQTYRKHNPVENFFFQDDDTFKTGIYPILTLDYDKNVSRETVEGFLSEYEYISYNSYSNGIKENQHRFRILLNIDTPLNLKDSLYTKYVKDDILESFTFDGFKPDEASLKDGWMGLPAYYDGKRNPDIKYNSGIEYDITNLINKISVEQMVKRQTKSKINESVYGEELNTGRQSRTYKDAMDELKKNYVNGNRHNALYNFIVKATWIGMEPIMIRQTVSEYENNINKMSDWYSMIDKYATKNSKVVNYFYKLEYKEFKGEQFLYDNVNCKYYDIFKDKWVTNAPKRAEYSDYVTLAEHNKIYKQILNRVNDRNDLAIRLFKFLTLLMDLRSEESIKMLRSDKYEQVIEKGIQLKKAQYGVILFEYEKFKEILKNNSNDFWDMDEADDQQILIKVLKELVWVRPFKAYSENGYYSYQYFFSPKNSLLKLFSKEV